MMSRGTWAPALFRSSFPWLALILAQTEVVGEWSVLWQVPVEATAVQLVTDYFRKLAEASLAKDAALDFNSKYTPVKRLHAMRDSMPEAARSSKAGPCRH